LKPTHLALNLEILAFIEAARSVPLPYPSSNSATSPLPTVPPEDQQTMLLHLAQRLFAKVQSMKDPRDRDLYKKEMENVVGLLAYKIPESSSMAKYMQQERRDAVADQINSAILRKGFLAPSFISQGMLMIHTLRSIGTVRSIVN
jgi:hypothetical protein